MFKKVLFYIICLAPWFLSSIIPVDYDYYDSTVAACRKYGSASFYDGLKSRMFKGYTIDYEEWYPEISNDMNLG